MTINAARADADVRPKWRIAVVDDDASVRRSVSRLLRAARFDVFTFESAEAFLNGAMTSFACLVLDVQLGGQTGIGLYEHLEQGGRALPVVFMTSHEEYLEAGSSGRRRAWLRKPFEARDLIGAIYRVVAAEAGDGAPK